LFDNHPQIDAIVIACIESWIPFLKKMIKKFEINKVVNIVAGGNCGQNSIYKGLCAAKVFSTSNEDIVLIHDGVRPLITEETITDNINKVKESGNCVTCVKATETFIVKQTNGELEIPTRDQCMIARAPQSFYLKDILGVHEKAILENKFDFIDSCTMMTYYGYQIHTILGPLENIKITSPSDYFIFRAMVEVHENQQIFGF